MTTIGTLTAPLYFEVHDVGVGVRHGTVAGGEGQRTAQHLVRTHTARPPATVPWRAPTPTS